MYMNVERLILKNMSQLEIYVTKHAWVLEAVLNMQIPAAESIRSIPSTIPRDPGSPNLKMVVEPKYHAFRR